MSEPFFDYDLPPVRIAQHPAAIRDRSRLMRLTPGSTEVGHALFRDLPDFLRPGDLLVLNDSRVLPARLVGTREHTGGAWEALFLRQTPAGPWEALAQTRGYPAEGETFATPCGLRLKLVGRTPERHWLLEPLTPGDPESLLVRHGSIPLPPYIRKGRAEPDDAERYQTVYARLAGSVAAPTAGLHFTPELFTRLDAQGVARATVTLHVGLGTLQPVKGNDASAHVMHSEWASVPAGTADAVRATRAAGGRVIAVGTTVVRTLESAARAGELAAWEGETDLFVRPPFEFRAIDGLVTNFHLPRSTLLLLVNALAGPDTTRAGYAAALAGDYRFFSYGDAMLIL